MFLRFVAKTVSDHSKSDSELWQIIWDVHKRDARVERVADVQDDETSEFIAQYLGRFVVWEFHKTLLQDFCVLLCLPVIICANGFGNIVRIALAMKRTIIEISRSTPGLCMGVVTQTKRKIIFATKMKKFN